MARRKPAASHRSSAARHAADDHGDELTDGDARRGAVVAIAGGALIAASQWLVDPRAEAAFDAPKRGAVLVGGVVALAALGPRAIGASAAAAFRETRSWARAALALTLAALGWALVSALAAPRTSLALDGWRSLVLAAPLLAIGASRSLDGRGERVVLGAFWVTSAVTAALSLAQRLGGLTLFDVVRLGGRTSGFALIGNEGLVGLVMALAATTAAAVLAGSGGGRRDSRRARAPAAAMLALAVSALAASSNLTGWLALASGVGVVAVLRFGRRAVAWGCAGLVVIGALALVVPPLGHRLTEGMRAARHGDWNTLLTYRPVAWRTALEMTHSAPVLGNGPGTFEADFVPFRLAAEQRARARLALPGVGGHFAAAHNELLDAFAATGVVGGVLASGAVAALLAGSALRCTRPAPARRRGLREHLTFATLVCGAVAALTWFPLQSPATRVPLLLAAGRAWRGLRDDDRGGEASLAARPLGLALLVALAILALPELPRYVAEHTTYTTTAHASALFAPDAAGPSPAIVARIAAEAANAARWIPGDTRALTASAAAALASRDGALALRRYQLAAARAERAEIDLNVGRAHAILDQRPEALAAFVRAVWLAPVLASELPEAAKPLVADEVARREALLASGSPDALPPAPPVEAP